MKIFFSIVLIFTLAMGVLLFSPYRSTADGEDPPPGPGYECDGCFGCCGTPNQSGPP